MIRRCFRFPLDFGGVRLARTEGRVPPAVPGMAAAIKAARQSVARRKHKPAPLWQLAGIARGWWPR